MLRDRIKNTPIVGKICIIVYEVFGKFRYFMKSVCFRKAISRYRWRVIKKSIIRMSEKMEDKEIKTLAENIKSQREVRNFNYKFVDKYDEKEVKVFHEKDISYVEHKLRNNSRKKIYFPTDWSYERIAKAYNLLLIEQDENSPHFYFNEKFFIPSDAIILDCGTAEGNFSIENVDKVSHIYLFEGGPDWKIPLQKTFAKYRDKVTLVEKYISNIDNEKYITLDRFLEKEGLVDKKICIKMDIEGYEEKAIQGLRKTLESNRNITMAICAYHTQDSEKNIRNLLGEFDNYIITPSSGYMVMNNFTQKPEPPYIRRGILFVSSKTIN